MIRRCTNGSIRTYALLFTQLPDAALQIIEMAIAAGHTAAAVDERTIQFDAEQIHRWDYLMRAVAGGPAFKVSAADFAASWRELG